MIALLLALAAQDATAAGETRAQAEAAAAALHARLDANGDGYVTYAEVMAAARNMVIPPNAAVPVPDSAVARAAFADADRDGDGRISLAEEIAGADRAFDAADTNKDGLLSADEQGAFAMKALAREQRELAARAPLPCRRGAACDRRGPVGRIVR